MEPFQRWVFTTIKEIRDKGYYRLPSVENLSLEDKKETTEYLVEHDIPEFVFGGDNIERKEIHDIFKKGEEKSKDLVQSICGKMGGDKSSENTSRAREFTREVALKNLDDLDQMSQDDLYDYFKYLVLKSRDIVKEFKS